MLRHMKLCHNSWTSFCGECQVFRTDLENWDLNKGSSVEMGPEPKCIVVIPRAGESLVCYLNHIRNVLSTKVPEEHFYIWKKLLRLMKTHVCFCLIKNDFTSIPDPYVFFLTRDKQNIQKIS